jgi:hypothetical protein
VPQAWAAGSVFHLLQAILGLDANAHKKSLYVDPELPRWLPDITLHNLRVGESTITLRFWKEKRRLATKCSRWKATCSSNGVAVCEISRTRERNLPTTGDSKITENAD